MIRSIQDIVEAARSIENSRVAVAWPEDAQTLWACKAAMDEDIALPVLTGNKQSIIAAAEKASVDITGMDFHPAETPEEAADACLKLIAKGQADLVMKGFLDTKVILKAVLHNLPENRSRRVLSHASVMEVPGFSRLFYVADAAMNIAPELEEKKAIILNTVEVAHALGCERPKVALLCAKEKAEEKMPCTIEAAALAAMDIPECDIAGPLAVDNAVNPDAARLKGLSGPVPGNADVLIVPNIESGNILYKTLAFMAGAKNAGIIVGGAAPVVLTSRADSRESKLASMALAVLHAHQTAQKKT